MHLVDENGKSTPNAQSLIGATSGVYQASLLTTSLSQPAYTVYAGAVIGIIIGIWIMDKFGRKSCLVYASTLGVIGAVGCCAAQNMAMFIAFRLLAGGGAWAALCICECFTQNTSCSIYLSLVLYSARLYFRACSAQASRTFVGLTGVILMLGQAIASYMGLAFYSVHSNTSGQWRGPLGIQILFPAISLAVVYWLPESPRWCLMNNQTEKARNIVMSLHGTDAASQEFASAEFDRTLDNSWWTCVTKPSYRKRFEMCCLYGFISQSTGLLVLSAYGSVLYGTLGYDARQQIIFQCGYITVGVVFNILGKFCSFRPRRCYSDLEIPGDLIVDIVGRKVLMLIGLSTVTFWMIVETSMVAAFASPVPATPNKAGIAMAVAAL
jgi:MFS family permease